MRSTTSLAKILDLREFPEPFSEMQWWLQSPCVVLRKNSLSWPILMQTVIQDLFLTDKIAARVQYCWSEFVLPANLIRTILHFKHLLRIKLVHAAQSPVVITVFFWAWFAFLFAGGKYPPQYMAVQKPPCRTR